MVHIDYIYTRTRLGQVAHVGILHTSWETFTAFLSQSARALAIHRGKAHGRGESREPECNRCGRRFAARASLKRHRELCGKEEKERQCVKCCKVLSSAKSLRRHLQAHEAKEARMLLSVAVKEEVGESEDGHNKIKSEVF